MCVCRASSETLKVSAALARGAPANAMSPRATNAAAKSFSLSSRIILSDLTSGAPHRLARHPRQRLLSALTDPGLHLVDLALLLADDVVGPLLRAGQSGSEGIYEQASEAVSN